MQLQPLHAMFHQPRMQCQQRTDSTPAMHYLSLAILAAPSAWSHKAGNSTSRLTVHSCVHVSTANRPVSSNPAHSCRLSLLCSHCNLLLCAVRNAQSQVGSLLCHRSGHRMCQFCQGCVQRSSKTFPCQIMENIRDEYGSNCFPDPTLILGCWQECRPLLMLHTCAARY